MSGVFENIDNLDADEDRKDREERAFLARKYGSLKLDPDWYENSQQMLEDIQGRPASAQKAIKDRVNAQQSARRPFATGAVPMISHGQSGAYHAAIGANQQANALQNMISQTMDAHQDEHDSRVSQLREIRRMEHEKELKRMELEALIARLGAMR